MKDIYELLNDADIDFSDIKEMKVDELERKRGKQKLINSIKNKNQKGKKRAAVAAASITIAGLICGSMVNPSWAQNIPIVGNLIQRTFIDVNPEFENYMNVVGQTSSYNNIDITFENAIADRNMLMLSYIVKDNSKPIEHYFDVLSPSMVIKVNGEQINKSGGAGGEKIDDNTVRILQSIYWNFKTLPDKLNIEISDTERNMDIKFSMDTKEIESNTKIQEVNKELNIDNRKWNLENITVSPVMTNVKYYVEDDEYDPLYSFLIFDQDGNELKWRGGKSSMKGTDDYVEGRVDYNFNYVSRENITKLTFIPIKSEHEENPHILSSQKVNVDNFEPISFKITDNISLIVEKLDVRGSKITVEYNYYYNGKKISSLDGGNLFVKGDGISKIDDDDGWNVEAYNIGENREIEIGCYDTKTNNIFEDKAFTLDIK